VRMDSAQRAANVPVSVRQGIGLAARRCGVGFVVSMALARFMARAPLWWRGPQRPGDGAGVSVWSLQGLPSSPVWCRPPRTDRPDAGPAQRLKSRLDTAPRAIASTLQAMKVLSRCATGFRIGDRTRAGRQGGTTVRAGPSDLANATRMALPIEAMAATSATLDSVERAVDGVHGRHHTAGATSPGRVMARPSCDQRRGHRNRPRGDVADHRLDGQAGQSASRRRGSEGPGRGRCAPPA